MRAHRSVLAFLCGLSGCVLLLSCDSKRGGGMTEPTPSFSISIEPASIAVAPGQSVTVTVTVTRSGGFAGPVNRSLDGRPGGVTGTFQHAPVAGGSSESMLTVQVGETASPGTYSTTRRASAAGLEDRSAALSLTVTQPPSIAVAMAPAALALDQGGSGVTSVTVTRTNFSDAVELALEGAPAGATGSFAPASLTGGATASTLTVAVGSSATSGTHALTVRARGTGVADATAAFSLTIAPQPAYALAVVPASLQLQQGAASSARIAIARTNFTSAIALAVSGAPQGVAATMQPVGDYTPWIRLISQTGAVVANASGAQAAQINVNTPVTGTFTVIVGTADLGRDAEGSYILARTGGNGANGTKAGAAGSRQR